MIENKLTSFCIGCDVYIRYRPTKKVKAIVKQKCDDKGDREQRLLKFCFLTPWSVHCIIQVFCSLCPLQSKSSKGKWVGEADKERMYEDN